MKKKSNIRPIVIILFIITLLPSLDQFLTKQFESYGLGLIIRIITHLAIPLIFYILYTKDFLKSVNLYKEPFIVNNDKGKKLAIKFSIIGAFGATTIITGLFLILKPFMNFEAISNSISLVYDITLPTYIIIGLSISLLNPLIEEYFWRGFMFKELQKTIPTTIALMSGAIFALHHAIMLFTWFRTEVLLIIILGLILVGIIFNWMYKKTGSIYSSLITHMMADITIIIIGYFVLFG